MRTGKLVKFQRPGGLIHIYLYRDGSVWRAAVYTSVPGRPTSDSPTHALSAASDVELEKQVREWVDRRYPR